MSSPISPSRQMTSPSTQRRWVDEESSAWRPSASSASKRRDTFAKSSWSSDTVPRPMGPTLAKAADLREPTRISGQQQHLAGGLSAREHLVRLGRLRERESSPDAHRQLALADEAEQLAGPRQELRARGVVGDRRPGEVKRPVLRQELRVERRHRAARLPEEDQHPAGPQRAQGPLPGVLADRVVDDVDPLAGGELARHLLEVVARVEDGFVGGGP